MAADTRPFKSKEQDCHGNEIIIRDQQLVEQTSQTTMASGEYFEIVDVDGRMAKIPKDNMIGVVREALGTLLNSLTDQTTVAKFLTLNGNTLGASAAATAASVLGVMRGGFALQQADYNNLDNNTAYNVVNGTNGPIPVNVENPVQCEVFTIGIDNFVMQVARQNTDNTYIYVRFKWSAWTHPSASGWMKFSKINN